MLKMLLPLQTLFFYYFFFSQIEIRFEKVMSGNLESGFVLTQQCGIRQTNIRNKIKTKAPFAQSANKYFSTLQQGLYTV